ncbi:3883_t:CDS:2 [Ambispora leptoticha]|uniref:3883_t:CDS:1 n=1 Tax=Ambispora leptoticha TaxID=144679 RepID=A0A9N8VQE5_9GLOM|nr:3883_t:CDS:2 [Ambispora leptoticha]
MNTEFPKNLTIPEDLKVPAGNVFKFVLYGIGVMDYKYSESESAWGLCKSEFILANYPKDLYFNSSSIVAMASGAAADQFGNVLEGVTKSLIPGDNSLCDGKSIAIRYYPDSKSYHGGLGKSTVHQGSAFSDITYIHVFVDSEHPLPVDSLFDGYIYSTPVSNLSILFYKAA